MPGRIFFRTVAGAWCTFHRMHEAGYEERRCFFGCSGEGAREFRSHTTTHKTYTCMCACTLCMYVLYVCTLCTCSMFALAFSTFSQCPRSMGILLGWECPGFSPVNYRDFLGMSLGQGCLDEQINRNGSMDNTVGGIYRCNSSSAILAQTLELKTFLALRLNSPILLRPVRLAHS